MSTINNFGGRTIIEPGAYSQIKANVANVPVPFSSGNVLIIDTGFGANYGGGSGINGELSNGLSSVYTFDNLIDARRFVRGGALWHLLEYLFIPANGAQGANVVHIVKAATTTSAETSYTLTNGSITFNLKNEGAGGNGATGGGSDTKVRTGYGCILKQGIIDSSKYYLEFYEGTFKGNDADGDSWDGMKILESNPITICRSIEFSTIAELKSWCLVDSNFNARFILTSTITGTGAITTGDFTSNNTTKLFSGGTESYGSTDLDDVLSNIKELDYSFILALKNADNAQSSENTKLLYHITNESEFKRFLVIGGGNDSTKFTQTNGSIETAKYFDSPYVIVCHSGFKENMSFSSQKKNRSSLYHAALVTGRLAGLAPQTSATFKTLRVSDWNHILNQGQRELALQAGVLHNRFVPGIGNVINQAINTIQKNTQMINPDGTSNEISIMRIAEQINKELVLNTRPLFVGGNLNTSSPEDVRLFIEGYLLKKTASKIEDGLIIRFEKITVKQTQDYYEIRYCFIPNSPINKLFMTGFMLDANLSA